MNMAPIVAINPWTTEVAMRARLPKKAKPLAMFSVFLDRESRRFSMLSMIVRDSPDVALILFAACVISPMMPDRIMWL